MKKRTSTQPIVNLAPTESSRFGALEIEASPAPSTATLELSTPQSKPQFKPETKSLPFKSRAVAKDGVYRNALGQESSAEHRHVALAWQKNCLSMEQVKEKTDSLLPRKRDIVVPRSKVRVEFDENSGKFICPEYGYEYTESGIKGLLQFSNVPLGMVNYLWQYSKPASWKHDLAKYINEDLQDRKAGSHGDFTVRLYKSDSKKEVIRHVASESYVPFDTHHLINLISEVLPEIGGVLVSHASIDRDRLFANLLFPDRMKSRPDSDYGVGAAIRTSEIGESAVGILPFLFRTICMNGNIWGRRNSESSAERRHRGESEFDHFRANAKNTILSSLNAAEHLLDRSDALKEVEIPDLEGSTALLAKRTKLNSKLATAWAERLDKQAEESGKTAFTVIQALTASAQDFDGGDRFAMESLSGSLLVPETNLGESGDLRRLLSYWTQVAVEGETVSDKDRKAYVQVSK